MTAFLNFKFARQTQSRRRKLLSEVMPVGDDVTYFVLLSDAYLTLNENEWHITSFEGLEKTLGHSNDLTVLQTARARGQITEGCHGLPDIVAQYLIDASAEPPQLRQWIVGDEGPVTNTVDLYEIKDAWARSDFEEVEVGDPSGKWYFRVRSDNPLIFLAVKDDQLVGSIRSCEKYCREVAGDFLYAP